jgi:O-antigen ligase
MAAMPERNHESAGIMQAGLPARVIERVKLREVADWLVVAVAVSLPWSTSATGILIVLWLIAVVPTFDGAALRRELLSAAGGLPLLLWGLGAVGMLWADASWSERIAGLSGFHKLLVIPLLLAQFRRSTNGTWVILGFLVSCLALLIASWALVLTPGLTWRGKTFGVPVKDYILQSGIFAICAFGLIARAAELWRTRMRLALVLLAVSAGFLANILYVTTARTTLVVAAILIVLLGLRQFGWKGLVGACVIGGLVVGAGWATSPNLRQRVTEVVEGVQSYASGRIVSSEGLRLALWRKSVLLIAEAPVIGHGTGSIRVLFERDVTPETKPIMLTSNPHSQILTVALQLGLIGTAVLAALWIAHLALFRDGTLTAWYGLVAVVYNVVSSLFNSHLFDFSLGWLYVFGVGVIGGMVLRGMHGAPVAERKP